jgi:hypothetical protein
MTLETREIPRRYHFGPHARNSIRSIGSIELRAKMRFLVVTERIDDWLL